MTKKKKHFITTLKNVDYRKLWRKFKNNAKNFVKYNRQFLSYTILTLISCTLVRIFTLGGLGDWRGIFFDFSVIIILGSFAYLLKPRRQFAYFLTIMIIFTIMNIINGIYYDFFSSFVSFGLLATAGQTGEVTDAVFEKLKIVHFIYLLAPFIFVFINRYLKKKDYFDTVEKIEEGKRLLANVLIVGGICLSINITMLTGSDVSRFSKQWNREYIVERFGIIIYQGNDLFQTLRSYFTTLFGYEEAAKNFKEYFEAHPYKASNNEYTKKFEGYNVVVIHMESIMNFLIDLKINNKEVTPNLNKLVKESMYFDNFYAQVSSGTSSDTEFTFNTSLMPAQIGTVFVNYYNRSYVTLEKLLAEKGYYTFSMHGNRASMWNRNKMHMSLGYMDFYSEEYYDIDEIVGLGLSDHSFFKQSEQIIKRIDKEMIEEDKTYKNYMGTLITLSNHIPFDDESYLLGEESFDVTYHTGKYDLEGNEIIYDYIDGTIMGNYIKSVHYADACLGEFLDYVRKSPEYDKTLFVLYGDHAAQISKADFDEFINYDFLTGEQKLETDPTYVDYDYFTHELFKNTPLILWTKDKNLKGTVSYPMGMIDVLPTIGNMLGIKNEYALGNDIFEVKNNNIVVFPNGNFLTDKLYYYNSKDISRIFGKDTIEANYIEERKKYAEDILSLSNDIIVYDLIDRVNKEEENGNEEK